MFFHGIAAQFTFLFGFGHWHFFRIFGFLSVSSDNLILAPHFIASHPSTFDAADISSSRPFRRSSDESRVDLERCVMRRNPSTVRAGEIEAVGQ